MTQVGNPARLRKALVAIAMAVTMPVGAETNAYDFVWYSGAYQPWTLEAGGMVFVDVYDDPSTPENDVYFRFRNGIKFTPGQFGAGSPDGSSSSIVEIEVDTGTVNSNMFKSLSISGYAGGVDMHTYTPTPSTFIGLVASSIAWSGDYAAGGLEGAPLPGGINPGESLTLKAVLKDGLTYADVINAMNTGMSAAYVEGDYGTWTQAQKNAYRAGAVQGLRFAMLVHSVLPNTWNNDGHGLYVTHKRVGAPAANTPQITALTATPASILDNQTSQLSVVANDPEPGPQALTYLWTIVGGGGTLDVPTSATPTYYPDNVTATQTVTLQVDVSDGATTVSRTLTLQVQDANAPPPNAAPQITGLSATPATILDTGTSQLTVAATDPDGGPQALGYQWTIVTGGGVLDNATSATPVYTPPDVVGNQTVTLKAQVSDGEATASGNLTLTVQDANPPPVGTVLLSRDFNSGDLSGWSVHDEGTDTAPSKWRIFSGMLVQQTNIYGGGTAASELSKPGTYLAYDGGANWTNYRLKYTMRSIDDDTLGAMFRYGDANHYYRFSWDKQRSYRRLVKKVDGVYTELAADNVPYVQGQAYQVEIVALGSQLEVWIDGVRIFQVNDSAHGRGGIAFYAWMNDGAQFDDLQVNAME